MPNGILIVGGKDESIESRAIKHSLKVMQVEEVDGVVPVPFEKAIIVNSGVPVPWDLLPAAFGFLSKWDLAIPMWQYNILAKDVGSEGEREITKKITKDLRIPLLCPDLIFVKLGAGEELLKEYINQLKFGDDKYLALLRATFVIKPRLCVLPTTWLLNVRETYKNSHGQIKRSQIKNSPLVRVELSPGRFVKCHREDMDKVIEDFKSKQPGRGR